MQHSTERNEEVLGYASDLTARILEMKEREGAEQPMEDAAANLQV